MTSWLNLLGLNRRNITPRNRIPIATLVVLSLIIVAGAPGELKSLFLLFGILLKPRILFDRDRAIDFIKVSKG
jgi:hypothetical protein